MAPFDVMNGFGLQTLHHQTTLLLSSELASTSLLIVLLTLPVLLLQHRRFSSSPPTKPLWLRIFFVLDPAIEFPLIHAFHPVTLAYPPSSLVPYLGTEQLFSQIGILYTIGLLFQNCVLRFVDISVMREDSQTHGDTLRCGVRLVGKEDGNDDGTAEAAIFDFVRPRGALLLGVTLLGIPSALTQYVGRLHPATIIGWLVLQQVLESEA